MNKAGAIAQTLTSKVNSSNPFIEVFINWSDIVGSEVAGVLTPYKISTILGRNVLILKTNDSCTVELQHRSMKIVYLLNHYFKSEIFSVIRVIRDAEYLQNCV